MSSGRRLAIMLALAVAQVVSVKAAMAAEVAKAQRPPVIKNLEQQGLEIFGEFDAPGGLRGFAGASGSGPVALYVTPDGEHAVVGAMVNSKGEDMSAAVLERLVSQPLSQRMWEQLERSQWVIDGNASAPRVVYVFTDPNCTYCHRFWEASRRWVQSGKVQLRHILVGVIRADSANKAAAILTAKSPSEALTRNEQRQAEGGIEGVKTVSAEVQAKLDANERLMHQLGIQGTPGILFRDERGIVQSRSGMPAPEDMRTVLGSF
ncbi:thiol:disulfide interchange protein DsbG [Steroidobacter cummioxidans]|uniref:thiol:disulfide interchange protein DsbG n=1 Tax=Steroidobacter cummioxidans TaxID=1803913 RepID=UPI000E314098|nr:thiol:disulfide interchange protein DsbG [Steroidobacter cummioxidans]